MIENFILTYAKLVVAYPQDLKIQVDEVDDSFAQITVFANSDDVGKLIGKNGNMINSIKTLINGCKAKTGKSYKIQVKALE